ncbi:alginate export family protein [Pseudomonas sp. S 311-6]|nr:alginate export family protein [Pseudomonas sp. S 311-6]
MEFKNQWMTVARASVLWLATASVAGAYELYGDERAQLNFDGEAVFGAFHSRESYAQSGTRKEGSSGWREGYLKYGFSGDYQISADKGKGLVYGKLNAVSSATFGDGDAAGWTTGKERRTHVEDAYLGWRSGQLFPALGANGLDISFGRQQVVVGDGFLIAGDALSFGQEISGGALNRGGAYYLGGRKAFSGTAVVRLGGDQGWRGDLMWIKSDNPAHAKPEMAVAVLEHVAQTGTVGATFIKVLDTDKDFDFAYPGRKGLKTYSLRAQGNAGVENLFLASQYAYQDKRSGSENAWYLEGGWTFSEFSWKPSVNYRYSRFSGSFDPLFYGNGRGGALGTWFQGEVAANYAGPFNTNTRVQHAAIKAQPTDTVGLGVLLYDFKTIDSGVGAFRNLNAREMDVYVDWAINPNFYVMSLLGVYKPATDLAGGGSQIGNSKTNVYGQFIFAATF